MKTTTNNRFGYFDHEGAQRKHKVHGGVLSKKIVSDFNSKTKMSIISANLLITHYQKRSVLNTHKIP
ncbi:MAG: hypothetical protein DA405_12125 [Bacteroidetes bacterium]|nr:MAG: hypothetical protein DA405_12125 [Bacteroidota bacterium]